MRATSDTIRILLILGAVLVIVGVIVESIIPAFGGRNPPEAAFWIGPIVLIIVSILIFIVVGVIHTSRNIPLNAVIMIVFLALEIILGGASFWSIIGMGLILEIVATTMLAMTE